MLRQGVDRAIRDTGPRATEVLSIVMACMVAYRAKALDKAISNGEEKSAASDKFTR